jgi:hypothetical protein
MSALWNAPVHLQLAKRRSASDAADAVVLPDINQVLRLEQMVISLQESISSKQSLIESL